MTICKSRALVQQGIWPLRLESAEKAAAVLKEFGARETDGSRIGTY